ncbi:hypothetical protein [Deinococcus sp. Marseille-Q6407]|uniref:hypothetical protein n=1 Tax=Deinococcus sp. Marseille-Q6407 TaxID=2969223 RepID=UPI0021BFE150|nr:hypothetical protein [Deinococcus sp. Marseille-Q6407]
MKPAPLLLPLLSLVGCAQPTSDSRGSSSGASSSVSAPAAPATSAPAAPIATPETPTAPAASQSAATAEPSPAAPDTVASSATTSAPDAASAKTATATAGGCALTPGQRSEGLWFPVSGQTFGQLTAECRSQLTSEGFTLSQSREEGPHKTYSQFSSSGGRAGQGAKLIVVQAGDHYKVVVNRW